MSFMPINSDNMALANILRGVQGGVRNPTYGPPSNQAVMYGAGANDPYMAQQAADPIGAANTALGQFGLSLPQNPNPFILFNNNPGSFAQNHPRIAGGLDNAAGVLANMGPTSMSAGDNISNVARGLMGNRAMHQQYLQQQYQAPFQLASQIGGLQSVNDQHAAQVANQNHINAITAGLPQAQADAHTLATAHASYFSNIGSARQTAADAAAYKADPAGYMVEKENERRTALGGDPMDADAEATFRKSVNSNIAQTAVAQAAGKSATKAVVPGKAPGAVKIDPALKMQHDDAQKDLDRAQKALDEHIKLKTGSYERNGGDAKRNQLTQAVAKAREALSTAQGNVSDAGGAAHSIMRGGKKSAAPTTKQPQWNMQTGRYE
jgi:hypothetical protein